MFYNLGNFKNALNHYSNAEKVKPISVETYFGKIDTLIALKDFKEAIKVSKSLLSFDSNNLLAHLKIIFSYIQL